MVISIVHVFLYTIIVLSHVTEAARSIGCKAKATVQASGIYNRTILSGGLTRDFILSVPQNYHQNNATGHPVILMYHGWGSSAADQLSRSNWTSQLVNKDAVVVFMDGYNQSWQGAPYAVKGVNDILFTRDVIHRLRSNLCVDTSRIYAVGFSNGGGFANAMACDPVASNWFAGFMASSGAFYNNSVPNNNCQPARRPIPFLEVHGLADWVIPYDGGFASNFPFGPDPTLQVPAIPDWVLAWAGRNGCASNSSFPKNLSVNNQTEEFYDWPTCAVRHYALPNIAHDWLGRYTSDPKTGLYKDEVSLIIEFLYKFRFVSKA